MYDPVAMASEIERLVARGDRRKYYRFRSARFYGGIATADCVGCCLRCAFCWGWSRVANPGGAGKLYGPGQVANRIETIARKHGFQRARLSGNEPTLGREHLLGLLSRMPRDIGFILETNGILIGNDRSYAEDLAAVDNLHVRVSIKGCNEDEFSRLTGAQPEAYALQLSALANLMDAGVSCHAAVMVSFSDGRSVDTLRRRLGEIDTHLADFEAEELFVNAAIEKRLSRIMP